MLFVLHNDLLLKTRVTYQIGLVLDLWQCEKCPCGGEVNPFQIGASAESRENVATYVSIIF